MPELLPVPLALPRPFKIAHPQKDMDDIEIYGSPNDFRSAMPDLTV